MCVGSGFGRAPLPEKPPLPSGKVSSKRTTQRSEHRLPGGGGRVTARPETPHGGMEEE